MILLPRQDSFEIEMTDSLKYMLGITEWNVHSIISQIKEQFEKNVPDASLSMLQIMLLATGLQPEHYTFHRKFMPDMSNGIKKMFIYCDEVEHSIVGNVKARHLASIPIVTEDQGSSSLCNYRPPEVTRGLIKCNIKDLHIGIYDTTFTALPFSAGTITIECVIEKNMLKLEMTVQNQELVPTSYKLYKYETFNLANMKTKKILQLELCLG
ncbi:Hypothetical predicted protein [Paramuricea clavata]|uniref:Uncharacterized protein n=1 Tax=Paramuricea clavata TaxID=317549 RepID=A0A6S7H3W0_PARCT|nr:Hypothetical predicted protein [Paramuricea clavata]